MKSFHAGKSCRVVSEHEAYALTKAAISLKRVKIDKKLLWRAYRNSQTLFRTVPSPTPYGLVLPKTEGSQPPPKTAIAIKSGTSKATDFKCGRYIRRVHPNKSPLQFWTNGSVRVSRDCQNVFGYTPILRGMGTARNFKFYTLICRIDRNKSP